MRLSVRGHRTGRPLALGALAFGGAAIALAGCAVVPAPKSGAASHPTGTASSGTGLTAAHSAAKPTPKQRAETDADAIFAAFAVPPGARKLATAPGVGGGVLKRASQSPASPDLVDKAGWWIAPGKPRKLLAWEAVHLPHQFTDTGMGSTSGPGTGTVWVDEWALRGNGVLFERQLVVQAVADGKKMAIRVDAQVIWIPARPASEKIPSAAKAVTISEDLGGNQGSSKPHKPVTITDPARVGKLIALIDGLARNPPVEHSCPAGFGDNLTLTFRAGPGKPALAVANAILSGCPLVDLTIGGKAQPVLAGVSGTQILQIAGLTWKMPVR